jgi:hypothetical protein
MSELGQNRPTSSTLECLLSPGPDMFREKTPMLGRTFRLDTSAGFGKRIRVLISRSDAAHNASVSSIDAVRVHDLRIMVAHGFRSLQI